MIFFIRSLFEYRFLQNFKSFKSIYNIIFTLSRFNYIYESSKKFSNQQSYK